MASDIWGTNISVGKTYDIFQVTNEVYIFADLLADQLYIDFANNSDVYLEE